MKGKEMKKRFFFMIFSILLFSDYKIEDNIVYFYDTNMEGGIKLDKADPESFVILNKKYSKDKNTVYYKFNKIPKADVETFDILYLLCIGEAEYDTEDKNNYYKGGEIVKKK